MHAGNIAAHCTIVSSAPPDMMTQALTALMQLGYTGELLPFVITGCAAALLAASVALLRPAAAAGRQRPMAVAVTIAATLAAAALWCLELALAVTEQAPAT